MTHITLEQRYEIEIGIAKNMTRTEIGMKIGKDKSAISREIKRNSKLRNNKYSADLAIKKAQERHIEKPKKRNTGTLALNSM